MSYFLQILVWNCFEQLFTKISCLNQFTFAKRSIKCFAKSTIYHRNELLKHPVNAVSKISGFVWTGLFMILGTLIKIQRRDRNEKRRLRTEFAFFQSLSRLFLPTYFVECKRTLLNLNSKGPYPSSEREIKFRRYLFTFSIKRKIRHLHVVVVLKQQKNVQKFVMHVQSCCFAY